MFVHQQLNQVHSHVVVPSPVTQGNIRWTPPCNPIVIWTIPFWVSKEVVEGGVWLQQKKEVLCVTWYITTRYREIMIMWARFNEISIWAEPGSKPDVLSSVFIISFPLIHIKYADWKEYNITWYFIPPDWCASSFMWVYFIIYSLHLLISCYVEKYHTNTSICCFIWCTSISVSWKYIWSTAFPCSECAVGASCPSSPLGSFHHI